MQAVKEETQQHIRWLIGAGNIDFWDDLWFEDVHLKLLPLLSPFLA
jgi:hypothetical protein